MSIFETIGMAWVIFTSAIASVAIFYLAYARLKVLIAREFHETETVNVPVEVKEMFKIAR